METENSQAAVVGRRIRRVPLAQLVEEAAEARAEREGVQFNSSI